MAISPLTVVGGVYREVTMWPPRDEIYGSAGRAACSIARLGAKVTLRAFADTLVDETMDARACEYGFQWVPTAVNQSVAFHYTHGLSTPSITRADPTSGVLNIADGSVLRYGMIEGTAVVDADRVVYDPQNTRNPESFAANGSRAEHLAIVLNEHEALTILGERLSPEDAVQAIGKLEDAEIVVLKRGARGALVWSEGRMDTIPAYETRFVSKIGSGDQFAAIFAHGWLVEGRSASDAAERASRATAFYCERATFPTAQELDEYHPDPLVLGKKWSDGYRANVYLAGPFFTLGQMWVVEQARTQLRAMGLDVFSPYHDIGRGDAAYVVPRDLKAIRDCDLVFAIADGLDSGTVYEIGYARAEGRTVVVYAENETKENLKMMEGSDCFMSTDFVSAIYRAGWIAASL